MPTFVLPDGDTVHLPALIAEAFDVSRNAARTMINDGAVKIDGEKVIDFDPPRVRLAGKTLRAGKRRFTLLSD
jgi:tyrosyl-tRNA synthetase